jgi:hypothetical protein
MREGIGHPPFSLFLHYNATAGRIARNRGEMLEKRKNPPGKTRTKQLYLSTGEKQLSKIDGYIAELPCEIWGKFS